MIAAILAAAALLGQAAAAPAPDPKAAAPAQPAPVSPVTVTPKTPEELKVQREALETKVVCRNEVVLGTLFPKKVCATIRETKERTAIDQAEHRKNIALSPMSGNTPSMAPF
jgi:hypothetical protein